MTLTCSVRSDELQVHQIGSDHKARFWSHNFPIAIHLPPRAAVARPAAWLDCAPFLDFADAGPCWSIIC